MTKQHKAEIEEAKALTPDKKKRINTNAKGRRSEKKTEAYLQERGWVVETTRRSSYRGGSNDFFGLFDHVAVANGSLQIEANRWLANKGIYILYFAEGASLYVQTKSNRVSKKTLEAIADFPARNKMVFVWKDNQEEPIIYSIL